MTSTVCSKTCSFDILLELRIASVSEKKLNFHSQPPRLTGEKFFNLCFLLLDHSLCIQFLFFFSKGKKVIIVMRKLAGKLTAADSVVQFRREQKCCQPLLYWVCFFFQVSCFLIFVFILSNNIANSGSSSWYIIKKLCFVQLFKHFWKKIVIRIVNLQKSSQSAANRQAFISPRQRKCWVCQSPAWKSHVNSHQRMCPTSLTGEWEPAECGLKMTQDSSRTNSTWSLTAVRVQRPATIQCSSWGTWVRRTAQLCSPIWPQLIPTHTSSGWRTHNSGQQLPVTPL